MNHSLKAVLFLLILCSLNDLKGQTDFRPGYVITNDKDTLHGLIDYRSDSRNSKKCDFKPEQNSTVQEFLPGSINGYRFTDGKFYVSKTITSDGLEMQLFLEFLVNGISDLYYYTNGTNSYYFIEKADGQLLELKIEQRQVNIDGEDFTYKSLKYIGLLKYAFADCQQIFPLINNVKLEDKSLIEITKKYHDYVCDGEKCIIYEKQLPAIMLKISPFISMNGTFMQFKDVQVYDAINFRLGSYPSIGLLLNTSLPKTNEKLSFQVSGEFGNCYFYGTGVNSRNNAFEEVNIHTSIVKVNTGFKYTYPTGRFRPTLLIGGTVSKLLNIEGRRVEEIMKNSIIDTREFNDVPITNFLMGYRIDLGADCHISKSFIAFFNLGYDHSRGLDNFMYSKSNSTIIKTVNLNAGIYF